MLFSLGGNKKKNPPSSPNEWTLNQKKKIHQKKSKKTCILWALHDLLVLPCSGWVPVLVSLLSSSFLKKRVLFHHGFPCPSSFRQGFRCLSPFFSLLLFSRKGFCSIMDFLVPPASGWGSGVCLPSFFFLRRQECARQFHEF